LIDPAAQNQVQWQGVKPHWVNDLDNHPDIGNFNLQYQGGDSTMRFAKIIPEPGNPSNQDTKPDGVTDFNPIKLYTSKPLIDYMRGQGKTLQIYWDDFKLWKNKQP